MKITILTSDDPRTTTVASAKPGDLLISTKNSGLVVLRLDNDLAVKLNVAPSRNKAMPVSGFTDTYRRCNSSELIIKLDQEP